MGEDLDEAGVLEPSACAGLTGEELQGQGRDPVGPHDLEGHRSLERRVAGEPDLAHPSGADDALEPMAAHHSPGLEAGQEGRPLRSG